MGEPSSVAHQPELVVSPSPSATNDADIKTIIAEYHNLAVEHVYLGKYSDALAAFEKAVEIAIDNLPEDHPWIKQLEKSLREVMKIVAAQKSEREPSSPPPVSARESAAARDSSVRRQRTGPLHLPSKPAGKRTSSVTSSHSHQPQTNNVDESPYIENGGPVAPSKPSGMPRGRAPRRNVAVSLPVSFPPPPRSSSVVPPPTSVPVLPLHARSTSSNPAPARATHYNEPLTSRRAQTISPQKDSRPRTAPGSARVLSAEPVPSSKPNPAPRPRRRSPTRTDDAKRLSSLRQSAMSVAEYRNPTVPQASVWEYIAQARRRNFAQQTALFVESSVVLDTSRRKVIYGDSDMLPHTDTADSTLSDTQGISMGMFPPATARSSGNSSPPPQQHQPKRLPDWMLPKLKQPLTERSLKVLLAQWQKNGDNPPPKNEFVKKRSKKVSKAKFPSPVLPLPGADDEDDIPEDNEQTPSRTSSQQRLDDVYLSRPPSKSGSRAGSRSGSVRGDKEATHLGVMAEDEGETYEQDFESPIHSPASRLSPHQALLSPRSPTVHSPSVDYEDDFIPEGDVIAVASRSQSDSPKPLTPKSSVRSTTLSPSRTASVEAKPASPVGLRGRLPSQQSVPKENKPPVSPHKESKQVLSPRGSSATGTQYLSPTPASPRGRSISMNSPKSSETKEVLPLTTDKRTNSDETGSRNASPVKKAPSVSPIRKPSPRTGGSMQVISTPARKKSNVSQGRFEGQLHPTMSSPAVRRDAGDAKKELKSILRKGGKSPAPKPNASATKENAVQKPMSETIVSNAAVPPVELSAPLSENSAPMPVPHIPPPPEVADPLGLDDRSSVRSPRRERPMSPEEVETEEKLEQMKAKYGDQAALGDKKQCILQ